MYGSETWKINKSDDQKVDVFNFKAGLRRILKISWQERVTNEEVLQMSGVRRLSDDVRRTRWQFIGYIMRKEPDNNCRMVLTWTPEGRRKRGRPKTTWRMTVDKERGRAGWRSWNRYVQLEKLNQGKLYHSIITPKLLVVTEQKVFPEKGCEQGRSEGSPKVPVTPPPSPLCKPFLSKQPTIFRGENAMTIIFDTV